MARKRHLPAQIGLFQRGRWGGSRPGAGRPPLARRKAIAHRRRPALSARFPVHVTLKVRRDLPNLRRRDLFAALRAAFRAVCDRVEFRLVHFSVQDNHVHVICEAAGAGALSRGMHATAIRIARGVNRTLARTGRVFLDRYHERILETPTEVRRALVYVINNARRHGPGREWLAWDWIDPCSSACYFDGWTLGKPRPPDEGPRPCVAPATWLLAEGWRRAGGLIAPDETPLR